MIEHLWTLKHSGSSLRDIRVTVQIHPDAKTVELVSDDFDSVQIADLAVQVLPNYGAQVVLDESGNQDIRPTWRLIYVLSGVRFNCSVSIIDDYSVSDGRDWKDPLKVFGKQRTVRLTALVEARDLH